MLNIDKSWGSLHEAPLMRPRLTISGLRIEELAQSLKSIFEVNESICPGVRCWLELLLLLDWQSLLSLVIGEILSNVKCVACFWTFGVGNISANVILWSISERPKSVNFIWPLAANKRKKI
jgi:hypothetical protein